MAKLVHLRLPDQLLLDSKTVVEEGGYSTLSEFIKESLRKAVDDYKHKKALYLLEKNFGRGKGKVRPLTHKDREEAAEELFKTDTSDIFRKYGLK